MAYWIDETAKVGNRRQLSFFMDTDADINSLPTSSALGTQQGDDIVSCLYCGKGSAAISIESGKIYILNSNDQWIAIGG